MSAESNEAFMRGAMQEAERHQRKPAPPPSKADRLRPVQWGGLQSLPRREYLIKRLLDKGGLSVVYGESNSGKSFFALDLSLSLARGVQWRDRRTRQCPVVYIAAEGGLGLVERLDAYQSRHNVSPLDVPFHLIAGTVDLCGGGDAETIIQLLESEGIEPGEIVVDTLAAAFGGGNENQPDDMGRFRSNIQRLREATGAHVLVVHHTGKDTAKGARGHSSLRAATDTEIEIVADSEGNRTATVTKQRDGATGDEFHFRLEVIDTGLDEDGDHITSCIIVPTDSGPGRNRRKKSVNISPKQRRALTALQECIVEQGKPPPNTDHFPANVLVVTIDAWKVMMQRRGVLSDDSNSARTQWRRIHEGLSDKELIAEYGGYVWIVSADGTA